MLRATFLVVHRGMRRNAVGAYVVDECGGFKTGHSQTKAHKKIRGSRATANFNQADAR
jgi:hypothetical protein